MNTIGERCKEILKRKGLSGSFLAEKMEKPRTTISSYLNDRSYPNESFFLTLVELVPELNFNWLITGKGEMFLNSSSESKNVIKDDSRVSTLEEQLAEMKKQQDAIMMAFSGLTNLSKVNTPVAPEPVNEYRSSRHKTKLGSFSGAVHLTGNRTFFYLTRGGSC